MCDEKKPCVVCRCEEIYEDQIRAAVRAGNHDLDSVKRCTRAGMGRCQGGFCTYKILKILARETGKEVTSFTKRGPGSYLVSGKLSDTTDAGKDPGDAKQP